MLTRALALTLVLLVVASCGRYRNTTEGDGVDITVFRVEGRPPPSPSVVPVVPVAPPLPLWHPRVVKAPSPRPARAGCLSCH